MVATRETHSDRELCQMAFEQVGLPREEHVVVDSRSFSRPKWTCSSATGAGQGPRCAGDDLALAVLPRREVGRSS